MCSSGSGSVFCRFIRSACFVCPVQCVSAIYIICIVLPELCVYSCFSLSMPFLPEERKKKKRRRRELCFEWVVRVTKRIVSRGTFLVFFHYPWLGGVWPRVTHSLQSNITPPHHTHTHTQPRDHRKNNPSAEISFPFAYIFFFLLLALSRPDRLHAFLRLGLSKIGTRCT